MSSCKIVITDEVRCKIDGLDADTRRRLSAKFKFEIPYARHLPSVRLGRWDGKIAYFQLSGATYVNLLPEIVEWLTERNYSITIDDRRPQQEQMVFSAVAEDSYQDRSWPVGHVMAGKPIMLRDYQVEIVNNYLANQQSLQEVATGAGKTLMTAVLSHKCEEFGRTIVIVPNKDLVNQTEADYRNMGLDVGVYFGDRKDWGKTHTICTWQSLNVMLKGETEGKLERGTFMSFIDGVIAVIVDEVHMAKADVLKALLTEHMGHIPIRWGLTGTVPKDNFEFIGLKVSIGEVISRLSASDLQEQGVLAQCHVKIIQTEEHSAFADYQKELKYLTTNSDRLDYLAGVIKDISADGNTLILVDRVECGKGLQARLTELFSKIQGAPDVAFVNGEMKSADRKDQYDEIADAQNKIIIATYGVAAVGINIPRIFNLVLIEPGKSFVRVIQSIGRGIRKAQDKDKVNIYDITGNTKFAKRHLLKRKQFYKEASYPFSVEKASYK